MPDLNAKRDKLNKDYFAITGRAFKYLFCPILYIDEDTELIVGHITNQALPVGKNEKRGWTVQRKDVDNLYGAIESDFVLIQYDEEDAFEEAFFKESLKQKFQPKLTLDGKEIGFFIAKGKGAIPEEFSTICFEMDSHSIDMAVKLPRTEVESNLDGTWEVEVSKDIQIQAIGTLLKAAHLTLFELIGYKYALSSGGYFIGHDVLGKFFHENSNQRKNDHIITNAKKYFYEYIHLARPVQDMGIKFSGTLNDGMFLLVQGHDRKYWGFIVLINTAGRLNAVLLPVSNSADSSAKYLNFLKNEQDILDIQVARFKNNKIEVDPTIYEIHWEKKLFS